MLLTSGYRKAHTIIVVNSICIDHFRMHLKRHRHHSMIGAKIYGLWASGPDGDGVLDAYDDSPR